MKARCSIPSLLLLALLAACRPNAPEPAVEAKATEPAETPSPVLAAIDSLAWTRPDSALTLMADYWAGRNVARNASTMEHDRHYAHLLTAELLYKNYQPQANREDVLLAVAYFDNMMQAPEPAEGPSNKQTAFLAARAHYINGVGLYEQDSLMEA